MKINWKVRFKNPLWVVQVIASICLPVLAYYGYTVEDLTSWATLGGIIVAAVKNPYVLGMMFLGIWNATNDPTTRGANDSERALTFTQPK